ncbi:MAG: PAS domain-containing protein, partial [Solirubrobacteraceae bacterium]
MPCAGARLRLAARVSSSEDAIVGASTVAREINGRSQSEARIRYAEARFRKAFDNAPIGMAILSEDGRIEQANAALGAICGVSDAELEGGELRRLVSTSQGQRLKRALQEILSGRDATVEIELRVIRSAGSAVYVSMTGTRLPSADAEPPHVLCQIQDITARRS